MACVPAGWYLRGVDEDTHRCEQMGQPRDGRPMSSPSAQVWLDTFWIDRTEVTVAAWHACVEAGACERVRALYPGFSDPDQPMTGQDWFQSLAYCQWRGATLPTEAQWEAAARGPAGTTFPWGEEPADCDRAILEDGRGRSCGRRQPGSTPERGRVWPVASLPAGHFGLFDMAGNAEEWVMDWWTPDWDACGEACAPVNPRGPCEGSETCPGRRYRVIRGGSWYWDGSHATGWHRRRHTPDNRPPHHFGFRCARVAGDAAD
jgi:formylglycine-generating enzyme required for sulfatase activity